MSRTETIHTRCTPDVRQKLDTLKERTGKSEADLWEEKVLWEHGEEIGLSDGRRYKVRIPQTGFDRRLLQNYIESALSDKWDNKLLVLPTNEQPALELTQRYWSDDAAYVVEIEEPDSFSFVRIVFGRGTDHSVLPCRGHICRGNRTTTGLGHAGE